jgi:hypothetical protein
MTTRENASPRLAERTAPIVAFAVLEPWKIWLQLERLLPEGWPLKEMKTQV